jgi:hypothetical protein
MKKLLTFGAAAIACAAFFGTSAPAAAKDFAFCRVDISSSMLQCGFDTMAQCQDMSSGRGGSCINNPSLGATTNAYAYAPVVVRKTHVPHRQK